MSLESIHKALSEMEEREKAASPGPWENEKDYRVIRWDEIGPHRGEAILETKHFPASTGRDCDFIAHSRQDLPKLIESLRVAVEYIEADMDSGDPVIRFTANASLLHISSILSEGSHG